MPLGVTPDLIGGPYLLPSTAMDTRMRGYDKFPVTPDLIGGPCLLPSASIRKQGLTPTANPLSKISWPDP